MPKRIRAASRKGTVLLLVALPVAAHRQLSRLKKATGATMNELVRQAVVMWLRRRAPAKRKP